MITPTVFAAPTGRTVLVRCGWSGQESLNPSHVEAAAFACFGVSAVAGLIITIMTGHWWFIIVGLACILAAWFYTGGSHPNGYAGLGETFVFIFFGLVAVGGTVYVQADHVGHCWLGDGLCHRCDGLCGAGGQQSARHRR